MKPTITSDLSLARWRKSSYSNGTGGECVEVADAALPGVVPVRDSKNPGGPVLLFPAHSWAPFLHALKDGLSRGM
ncbi:DUF397 domain-containing protein [Streptomyces sp. NK08204]|uniref:DUF397 domain-containing protein n=1 Tax=Streptomyces sp. NK08204 TaxID=2873260 RepID=UPI001CECD86A|nr:DUF397 domain-containing protein [Streptomyces sp. NK08204]